MKNHFQKLFNYSAVIFLILIALHQQYQAHKNDLSPWKGGGFGMFSTYDSPGARTIQAFLIVGTDTIPVKIPRKYKKLILRTKTLPNKDGMEKIAKNLLEEEWMDYGNISYAGRNEQEQLLDEDPTLKEKSNDFQDINLSGINSEDPRANDDNTEIISKGNTIRYVDVKKKGKQVFSEAKSIKPNSVLLILWKLEFFSESPSILRKRSLDVVVKASQNKQTNQ